MTKHLLVADDDAAIASVVRRYFAAKGWDVESCGDAAEALSRVESEDRFDAVICDLHFTPARLAEGFGLIERARRKRPGAALVLFTGAAEDGVKAEALRLGADEVVTKPAALASLHEAVLRAMKQP